MSDKEKYIKGMVSVSRLAKELPMSRALLRPILLDAGLIVPWGKIEKVNREAAMSVIAARRVVSVTPAHGKQSKKNIRLHHDVHC